jgi:hypothetical protein
MKPEGMFGLSEAGIFHPQMTRSAPVYARFVAYYYLVNTVSRISKG